MGARRNWTKEDFDRMTRFHHSGASLGAMADEFKVSTWTIRNYLKKLGLVGRGKQKPGPRPEREVKPYSFQEIPLVSKSGSRVAVIVADSHSLKDVLAGLWE